MKIFLISQNVNVGYDTYDSAVVVAENEDAARKTHPSGSFIEPTEEPNALTGYTTDYAWTSPDKVMVEYLGEAPPDAKTGVRCASFNAG